MVLSCIDDIISCHRPVTPAIVSVPLVPQPPCRESVLSAGRGSCLGLRRLVGIGCQAVLTDTHAHHSPE